MTATAEKPRKRTNWKAVAVLTVAVVLVLVIARWPIPGILLAAAVLTVAGLVLRARWARYAEGGRIAAWKRRKYQGTASKREIRTKLSTRAAARRAATASPGLHPSEAAVIIGEAKGQLIADTWDGARLVYAPPRTLKTGLTSCWAADVPGTAVLFSSRCDQHDHTYHARAARGEIRTLNADGEGGIPTDFAWSPLDGCETRATAKRRAGDLMEAAPRNTDGASVWIDDQTRLYMQYLLHAAALARADITTVRLWGATPHDAAIPVKILDAAGAYKWAAALDAMCARAAASATLTEGLAGGVEGALAWLDDDILEAAACPAPGDGINLRDFITEGTGTVYMIGADRTYGSLAPYFAAFGAEAFHVARSVAEATPGRRLRRPFVIVADEAATIAPLPWHRITAVSSGYGIGVTACFQADSQITARWGEQDAKTIRSNFPVKVIGPGFTDPGELEALSRICGDVDTWHGSKDNLRTQRLYPPERIRLLADWHALVLHRNARPVEVTVTPVWDRPGYQRAEPQPVPSQPAIYRVPERPAITVNSQGEVQWPAESVSAAS